MFHFGSRFLFLSILLGLVYAAPASDGDGKDQPEETLLSFPSDEASLNEMFREVEELMEDTQYKLSNAVKEVRLSTNRFAFRYGLELGSVFLCGMVRNPST